MNLTSKYNDYIYNLKYHLEQLKISNHNLCLFYKTDVTINHTLSYNNLRIDFIISQLLEEPRFQYQIIQNHIDTTYRYKRDYTGAQIDLDWGKNVVFHNRIPITLYVGKNLNTSNHEIH